MIVRFSLFALLVVVMGSFGPETCQGNCPEVNKKAFKKFRKDKIGCLGYRQEMKEEIRDAYFGLVGCSEDFLISLLGEPNQRTNVVNGQTLVYCVRGNCGTGECKERVYFESINKRITAYRLQ